MKYYQLIDSQHFNFKIIIHTAILMKKEKIMDCEIAEIFKNQYSHVNIQSFNSSIRILQ